MLAEFETISERGGVLGAMETGYQRGKIQEESLFYEHQKHSGELPIIGVNSFLNPEEKAPEKTTLELARSLFFFPLARLRERVRVRAKRLRDFQKRHSSPRHSREGGNPGRFATSSEALDHLKQTAISDGNIFEALMDAMRVCSLGQISHALFEVGGQYRRNM